MQLIVDDVIFVFSWCFIEFFDVGTTFNEIKSDSCFFTLKNAQTVRNQIFKHYIYIFKSLEDNLYDSLE